MQACCSSNLPPVAALPLPWALIYDQLHPDGATIGAAHVDELFRVRGLARGFRRCCPRCLTQRLLPMTRYSGRVAYDVFEDDLAHTVMSPSFTGLPCGVLCWLIAIISWWTQVQKVAGRSQ